MESDYKWFIRLRRSLPPNACLYLIPEDLEGIEKLLPREPFDIVVIDGLDRLRCAE